MGEVTSLIARARQGDRPAFDQLLNGIAAQSWTRRNEVRVFMEFS